MKTFRALSTALLLIYAIAFLGSALHVHSGTIEDLQCKLCKLSGTALVLTAIVQCSPVSAELHASLRAPLQLISHALPTSLNSRAPPLS